MAIENDKTNGARKSIDDRNMEPRTRRSPRSRGSRVVTTLPQRRNNYVEEPENLKAYRKFVKGVVGDRYPVVIDTNVLVFAVGGSINSLNIMELLSKGVLIACDIPKVRQENRHVLQQPDKNVKKIINSHYDNYIKVMGILANAFSIFHEDHRVNIVTPEQIGDQDDIMYLETLTRLLDLCNKGILVTDDHHLTDVGYMTTVYDNRIVTSSLFVRQWEKGLITG